MLLKPLTDWLIINLKQAPGKNDGHENDTKVEHYVHPHGRIWMVFHPTHLHIHEGIMRNIERVRKLAQPSAHFCAKLVSGHAAGTGQYNEREQQQDTHSLIDAVRDASLATDAGD